MCAQENKLKQASRWLQFPSLSASLLLQKSKTKLPLISLEQHCKMCLLWYLEVPFLSDILWNHSQSKSKETTAGICKGSLWKCWQWSHVNHYKTSVTKQGRIPEEKASHALSFSLCVYLAIYLLYLRYHEYVEVEIQRVPGDSISCIQEMHSKRQLLKVLINVQNASLHQNPHISHSILCLRAKQDRIHNCKEERGKEHQDCNEWGGRIKFTQKFPSSYLHWEGISIGAMVARVESWFILGPCPH